MSKAMNFYLDKNISRKYGQKPLSTTNDALNTASKMAIQKTTQTTYDLVGNKIAEKITRTASTCEDPRNQEIPKKIYVPPKNGCRSLKL